MKLRFEITDDEVEQLKAKHRRLQYNPDLETWMAREIVARLGCFYEQCDRNGRTTKSARADEIVRPLVEAELRLRLN